MVELPYLVASSMQAKLMLSAKIGSFQKAEKVTTGKRNLK